MLKLDQSTQKLGYKDWVLFICSAAMHILAINKAPYRFSRKISKWDRFSIFLIVSFMVSSLRSTPDSLVVET